VVELIHKADSRKDRENKMNTYTSKIKTYYFTIQHPETGKTIQQRYPATSLEMARKVLVMANDERVLNLILETKVSA
jgi:hypothetical protein